MRNQKLRSIFSPYEEISGVLKELVRVASIDVTDPESEFTRTMKTITNADIITATLCDNRSRSEGAPASSEGVLRDSGGAPIANNNNVGDPAMTKQDVTAAPTNNKGDPTSATQDANVSPNHSIEDPARTENDALASPNNHYNGDPARAEHDAQASPNNYKNGDPARAEHDARASPNNYNNGDPARTENDARAFLNNHLPIHDKPTQHWPNMMPSLPRFDRQKMTQPWPITMPQPHFHHTQTTQHWP
jgi:hypothetical protein